MRIPVVALVAIVLITTLFYAKGPLQDVHWDSPIYLSRGKTYADSPLLREYIAQANDIAKKVKHYKVDQGEMPYWGFTRLGNIVLLGILNTLVGPSLTTVRVAFLLYTVFAAGTLVLAVLVAYRVTESFDADLSKGAVITGALLSGVLYLASDVYRYMSGSLVADVPAAFLVAASILSLVQAVNARSVTLATLSGVLGFLVYAVKMDTAWVYVSFCCAYGGALIVTKNPRMWWPAFFAAAVASLACYAVYAWQFWPLADLRLFLIWINAQETLPPNPSWPIKAFVAAGGLLWIGLFLAVRYKYKEAVLWVALSWLVLFLLPYLQTIYLGRHAEVRYFVPVMLPLLLGSTIGWASLVDRAGAKQLHAGLVALLGATVITLGLLSQAESYGWLRQLPGGWRLQYAKEWLSPPNYERLSYPVEELDEISRYVYGRKERTMIVTEESKLEEYLSIVEYLEPPAAMGGDQDTHRHALNEGVPAMTSGSGRVTFALLPGSSDLAPLRARGASILRLITLPRETSAQLLRPDDVVLRTPNLALVKLGLEPE